MSYGFYAVSDSGTTQIDTAKSFSYFKVTQSGTGTTATTTSDLDIMFIKPVNGTTASNDVWGATTVYNNPGTSFTFKRNTTTTSVNYFVIRPTKLDSASSSGYGLLVYNQDEELAFDSGIFTSTSRSTVVIKNVSPPFRSGDPSNSNSIIYTAADYLSVYASLQPKNGTSQSINNGGSQSYTGHLMWGRNSTTTIRYFSFLDLGFVSGPFGPIGLGSGYFPSGGSLISAVLKL